MTDKDIIKALHTACLSDLKNIFIRNYITGEITILNMDDVLDLINRQQAEIERLNKEIQITKDAYTMLQTKIDIIKSEAIKEFAERLKEKSDSRFDYSELVFEISEGNIDNLVKEMVGEE